MTDGNHLTDLPAWHFEAQKLTAIPKVKVPVLKAAPEFNLHPSQKKQKQKPTTTTKICSVVHP